MESDRTNARSALSHSEGDSEATDSPCIRQAEVYGGDHSPWVQAVLLGLAEKEITWSLRSTPHVSTFLTWGVLMPAVSFDGGVWRKDSASILVDMGFESLSAQDKDAIDAAWQGVTYRPQRPARFLHAFATAGDGADSAVRKTARNFFRGFIALYMMTLITLVKLSRRVRDPDNWGDQFLYWENALASSSGAFIDGESPGSRDVLLFGMVQCHSSIPVPPLYALQDDPRLDRLRDWISVMQARFSGLGHLYSGRYFSPPVAAPAGASGVQQGVFYLGFLSVVIALPLTLPVVLYFIVRAPR